jgi:thiamine-monophosphate kinase
MTQDVHVRLAAEPESIGHKLMAVSLSDVAAMGGTPRHAVVALVIPEGFPPRFLDGIYRGMYGCAGRFGVSLVGGDTSRSAGGLTLSLTLTGTCARDRFMPRGGACVGDRILVSGTLGDAATGLALIGGMDATSSGVFLPEQDAQRLLDHLHRPEPLLELGRALAATGIVTAAIDLSDGLASDLGHICRRSGAGALVDLDALPVSDAVRRYCGAAGRDVAELAVGGGEDYELLLTAPAAGVAALERAATVLDQRLTDIGEITAAGRPAIRYKQGLALLDDPPGTGWDHFR